MTGRECALSSARRGRGFTLVELLVSIVLALLLVLAIVLAMSRAEAGRRSLISLDTAGANAAYASLWIDRTLRSAGSGVAQSQRDAYGCRLFASRSGQQLLPAAEPFAEPFTQVPSDLRLAPVLVYAGLGPMGSDVLAVMTGSSGLGEAARQLQPGSLSTASMRLQSTVGLRPEDLLLVFEQRSSSCMVQQVSPTFAEGTEQQLPLGGPYYSAVVESVQLTDLASTGPGWVAPLGNPRGSRPYFQLIGVNARGFLTALDALALDGTRTPTPIVEGIVELRTLYGVDENSDGLVDSWHLPTEPNWSWTSLTSGSDDSRVRLAQIVALRVGIISRAKVQEREPVAPTSVQLFQGMPEPLHYSRTLDDSERLHYWQAIEFTVPLRNALLAF